ncbi:hypothetical protein [Planococcus donghaensis]|uniref:hypothetical protein n=1 Tax=Planococcus donghaensis TaxID=414778 RepID=UPI0037363A86
MKQFIAYWQKPVFPSASSAHAITGHTHMLIISALLAALAAIFQSAGGLVPGIGYLISPFSTLPIVVASCISLASGFFAYVVAIGLLLMLQPGELFIFPFTIGLLGLAIGLSIKLLERRLPIVLLSGAVLFMGISFVAFVLQFPIFGSTPATGGAILLIMLVFSLIYSFLWVEISRFFLRRIFPVLKHR